MNFTRVESMKDIIKTRKDIERILKELEGTKQVTGDHTLEGEGQP
jgi:hypothetical protein